MTIFLVLIAMALGVVLPLQAGINAELRLWLGHPVQAALVSFVGGALSLFVLMLVMRLPMTPEQPVGRAPWWVWFGGVLGAAFVLMTVILAPRLGAATMLSAAMTGQLVGSLVIDHYGIVGYSVRSISTGRVAGVAFLIVGVLLVNRG